MSKIAWAWRWVSPPGIVPDSYQWDTRTAKPREAVICVQGLPQPLSGDGCGPQRFCQGTAPGRSTIPIYRNLYICTCFSLAPHPLSYAAFLPEAGEAPLQPDTSDCSCKGSHKEQQSLECVQGVPTSGWSPSRNMNIREGQGLGCMWVVGDTTATAQGAVGWGFVWLTVTTQGQSPPQVSDVGWTSGLASKVMLLSRTRLLVYFSSTLYM